MRVHSARASFLALLALTLLTLSGCITDDPGGDVDAGGDVNEDTDGAGGDTDVIINTADYFFVRIAPGEGTPASEAESEDPGADIDTVVLNDKVDPRNNTPKGFVTPTAIELRSDMTKYESYKPRNVADAGSSIDAFSESDPTMINASSTCSTSSAGFVSIGLPGDEGAVFTFDTAIDQGDDLIVVEVGGCTRDGATPGSEPYDIEVAVTTIVDANWVNIGNRIGDGPITTVSVPALPVVEIP